MTKKKEITLQDILNQMSEDFKLLNERFTTLEEKLAEISNCAKNAQPDTEKHSEPEIPNTAYVTLTEDGCFVGGEPATQYNGEDIYRPYLCVAYFKEARDIIRKEYGYELLELQCLQSSTKGEWAKTGNPVPDKDGTYAWLRAVYTDKEGNKVASRWVFYIGSGSASTCASDCSAHCGSYAQSDGALRVGLFGSVAN